MAKILRKWRGSICKIKRFCWPKTHRSQFILVNVTKISCLVSGKVKRIPAQEKWFSYRQTCTQLHIVGAFTLLETKQLHTRFWISRIEYS